MQLDYIEFEIDGKKYKDRNGTLNLLARSFRSTRDLEQRKQIADDYAKEVDRLIATGLWDYAPNFDEMLSFEFMPKTFTEYWNAMDADKVESKIVIQVEFTLKDPPPNAEEELKKLVSNAFSYYTEEDIGESDIYEYCDFQPKITVVK